MMENKIDEIRERLNDTTYAPWKRHDTQDYAEIHNTDTWGKAFSPIALVGHGEDADFIANAPSDMAYLLDLAEEKDKQIAELKKERDAAIADVNRGCGTCAHAPKGLIGKCDQGAILDKHGVSFPDGFKSCHYKWRGIQEEE